jgi:hypothetical protein
MYQAEEGSMSPAWDPLSKTPGPSAQPDEDENTHWPTEPPGDSGPPAGKCRSIILELLLFDSTCVGEWLCDPRLLNKRLDIRI